MVFFVNPQVERYIVSLVQATRDLETYDLKGMVEWGASPRASLALKNSAKGYALINGRNFVTPDDIRELAADVLRHRILVSFEAEARGIDSDEIVKVLLNNVTVP